MNKSIRIMKLKHSPEFALIELLVSITVIIVLASLVFVVSNRSVNSAHKAVCVTNLRGVGNGLQSYLTKHNYTLPGPLNTGQSALNNGYTRSLVTYIAEYLEGTRETTAGGYLVQNYGCPSLMKRIGENSVAKPAVVHRLEEKGKLLDINGKDVTYPWGYSTGSIPKRVDQLNPVSAGKVWVMIEQDQTMGGSWCNNGATEPAHGPQRMALFWDLTVRL